MTLDSAHHRDPAKRRCGDGSTARASNRRPPSTLAVGGQEDLPTDGHEALPVGGERSVAEIATNAGTGTSVAPPTGCCRAFPAARLRRAPLIVIDRRFDDALPGPPLSTIPAVDRTIPAATLPEVLGSSSAKRPWRSPVRERHRAGLLIGDPGSQSFEPRTARSASNVATSEGRERNGLWLEAHRTTSASALSAICSSRSTLIARSSVQTKAVDGTVRLAGGPAGSLKIAAVVTRRADTRRSASAGSTSR